MDDTEKFGGLNLLASLHGGPPVVEWKHKAASSGTQICPGDAVVEEINGQIETGTSVTPGESLYIGVSLNYGPANSETGHAVIVDPYATYDCTSNEDDELLSTKHRGKYCNLELGISRTRQSQHKLDAPSVSMSREKDMIITGPAPFPGEDDSRRVLVMINKHAYAAGYARIRREARGPGRPPLFASKRAFDRTMSIAFGLAMQENDFREERIAQEIDRLLRNGTGKFNERQLRKELDRYYPKLQGDSQRWCKIVVRFSKQ